MKIKYSNITDSSIIVSMIVIYLLAFSVHFVCDSFARRPLHDAGSRLWSASNRMLSAVCSTATGVINNKDFLKVTHETFDGALLLVLLTGV